MTTRSCLPKGEEGPAFKLLHLEADALGRLAQAAVHSPDILTPLFTNSSSSVDDSSSSTALSLYTELCESPAADPGPYDPDALINARMRTALKDGRAEELQRIAGKWRLDERMTEQEWEEKVGELGVLGTLLACATDPPGDEVKVDFFLVSGRARRPERDCGG